MKRFWLILNCLLTAPVWAATNVPLTVQEALYSGSVPGINRTAEPFCQGVPLADSAAITSTNVLGLTGASAGQFRILGTWPDGNTKWVEVCGIIPSLTAGGVATVTLTDTGSGNFGGGNLATDNGATITVATGAATFTIKKARFNGFDVVDVGPTHVVTTSSAATRGFILTGPDPTASFPGNATCLPNTGGTPCTTIYSSANDPSSTCIVEKNGPVQAVLKCTYDHVDGAGHVYMHGTARMYFYQGKTNAKINATLRNADYGASNTFATAYKGHQGYELRISPNISGTLNYKFANDTTTPVSGSLGATDSAYLYQGESMLMRFEDWVSGYVNPYTTDPGFSIVKNGASVYGGPDTKYPQGWADISDAGGTGVEIGIYQLSAYWPKSLEFDNGGSDVRIGIWPRQNSKPFYTEWSGWEIHDLYVNFHATAPASPANEFLKFQHYLVARAPVVYYNTTAVFPHPLLDPAVEDSYTASIAASAIPATIPIGNTCCAKDFGITDSNWALSIVRYFSWNLESEYRWGYMMNFLSRGWTGRWLQAAHWYRWQAEAMLAHSDGFNWRDHGPPGIGEIDGFGQPRVVSTNAALGVRPQHDWMQQDAGQHAHWYGETDYYFLTGDETIKDALIDQQKDWFVLPNSYQDGAPISGQVNTSGTAVHLACCGAFNSTLIGQVMLIGNPPSPFSVASVSGSADLVLTSSAGVQSGVNYRVLNGLGGTRAAASHLMAVSRFSTFLRAVGDPDYGVVQQQGLNVFNEQVKSQLCVSGYPAGCTFGTLSGPTWVAQGVSPVRGVPWLSSGASGNWCNVPNTYRVNSTFQASILAESVLEFRSVMGPAWTDYWNSSDLAYGISQWATSEGFVDNGTGRWDVNGFRYGIALDRANSCAGPGETPEPDFQPANTLTTYMHFASLYATTGTTTWAQKFKINMQKAMAGIGLAYRDFLGYQGAQVISILTNPGSSTLNTVPISGFTNNGGGSYTITWNTPPGTQYLRVKYANSAIVDWIGFDALNNGFVGNPASTTNWFAAANANGIPAPSTGVQSMTVNTGLNGLTSANFSVKAFTSSVSTPGPGPAAVMLLVSGGGQSGTTGQPLANPFVVKVTDASGNAISGISVTFAATGGGGTLSTTSVATNSSGLASSILTLGASAGTNTVLASAAGLSGSPITFTATGTAAIGLPRNLLSVSGSGQTGTTGQALASPFVVKITDVNGNPVSGIAVAFAVVSGGGSLSATAVATNSAGQASSILTLGTTPGTNSVAASSAGLTGSPITFTATGSSSTPPGSGVTWTLQTVTAGWPSYVGWTTPQYDPTSQQTIFYVGPPSGSHGIYSTDVYSYSSGADSFTHVSGSGSRTDLCPADTPTQPGDRHPGWQMAVDTRRRTMWMFGGVDGPCSGSYITASGPAVTLASGSPFVTNGSWNNAPVTINGTPYTIASVSDSSHLTLTSSVASSIASAPSIILALTPPNANPRLDMYYLQLNSNPTTDVWRQITPAHIPTPNSAAAMIYDPDDDVLFLFGYDGGASTRDNWIYCRTAENPTPGIATVLQLAAGCVIPDDWNQVNPVGGVQPPGSYFPGMVYDTLNKRVIQYGGGTPSGLSFYNQTWMYNVPTHTWTQRALSTTPPPVYNGGFTGQPAMAYISTTHKVLYHQTSNSGAPADWQYDLAADTWTRASSGGGAATDQVLAFDAANNRLVGWSLNSSSGNPDVWIGTLSSTASANRCDLNADGSVNIIDVQIATNQALGTFPCGSADLLGNGICSVLDVQRVVNASLGGSCVVGP